MLEPAQRPALILVVEDEVIVAKDLERTLSTLGYQVLGRASNAEDAVLKARAGRPDLILMDIRLPGKRDGVDAAKIIHAELHIPVVFLSGFGDSETLDRARATEPFGYILKPFNEGELRCAIEVALYKCQVDATLRKRERLMTTTLHSIGDGVVTTNEKQEITSLNRAAEQLTGWTTREALGHPLSDVMRLEDEDDGKPVEAPLRAAMESRGVTWLRDRTRLMGKTRPVSIDDSAAAIVDEGELLGGVIVFRDVTERRLAEANTQRLEAKYRSLFEHAGDGLWLLSSEGDLLEANRRAEEIHGVGRESLIGQHFFRYLSAGASEEQRFAQLDREGCLKATRVEVTRSDGTLRIVDLTASIVGLGEQRVILASERDVTQETALEGQLRQYQRLESDTRLTASVAHDFNNVLAAIIATSSCLIESLEPGTQREDAEEIMEAARRGASLTRQLLTFSRGQVVSRKPLGLNDTVKGVEKMLARLIGPDIALSFVPGAARDTVTADTGQLEQVIVNLVVNARDAMPRRGAIRIETSNVESNGPHVRLTVSDTGTGMDAATQRRVFEPFFTTRERGKGTGLGLSTCSEIVKQSGGSISLSSELGSGTVFNVDLPRTEVHPPSS